MGDIGIGEIIVVAVVALVLFGPNKIPEFARSCGKAVSLFKKGLNEGLEEEPAKKSPASAEKPS